MRSQGQVRFVRISSKLQMTAAGIAAAVVAVWVATMAGVLIASLLSSGAQADMLARKAAVESAESRVAKYKAQHGAVEADLQKRQDVLEKMVQSFGAAPQGSPAVSDSTSETDKTVRKISMEMPEAAGLARIEARQIALAERLTQLADLRAARAEQAIRRVGLNPQMMLASLSSTEAQGGPLIPLVTGPGNSIDPRFQRLGLSVARMAALERGAATIPNTLPAELQYISSGFGYRSDPFTGGAAFHPGLDFKGPIGAPIYAAAAGTVSFAGIRQGYGNCVEVSHGNGLVTRYAHMSRIGASIGQKVAAGTQIGQIGSTGRSTGPHLHFEVRINDRPVDPRPFLQGAPHVFQEASAGRTGTHG